MQTEPYPSADSHVGNDQMEYIVFNKAQIIPCYVVHLDWGKDNEKYFWDIPADPNVWVKRQKKTHPKLLHEVVALGDKQRSREALIAKASKYFLYGYGTATGKLFVVEDVGEVDEDEEEYGEYQKDGIDGVNKKTHIWE